MQLVPYDSPSGWQITQPDRYSERLGNPEHGAVVSVRVDRNVRVVPLEGISRIGGEALVLQSPVEDVDRDSDLPVASDL